MPTACGILTPEELEAGLALADCLAERRLTSTGIVCAFSGLGFIFLVFLVRMVVCVQVRFVITFLLLSRVERECGVCFSEKSFALTLVRTKDTIVVCWRSRWSWNGAIARRVVVVHDVQRTHGADHLRLEFTEEMCKGKCALLSVYRRWYCLSLRACKIAGRRLGVVGVVSASEEHTGDKSRQRRRRL